MSNIQTKIINYKGFSVELGELPEPRKGYWKILTPDIEPEPAAWVTHEVECGSWEDLERIAKRSIDATLERH